jgi:tRNA (cmo5U34)-methyltransferase
MNQDRIFAELKDATGLPLRRKTAAVFDDMVSRSVPYYDEMQRMTAEIAAEFAVEGTNLYDLGCATGTTLAALDAVVKPGVRFVGVDNSDEMLSKARQKLGHRIAGRPCDLVLGDLNQGLEVEHASVVVMILTLQFVRPLNRERVMAAIARGIHRQGALVLIEKLTLPDSLLNRLFIKFYYDHKRRHGYSEMEIANKREALENVMIPYQLDETWPCCGRPASHTPTCSSAGTTSVAFSPSSEAVATNAERGTPDSRPGAGGRLLFRRRNIVFPVVLAALLGGLPPELAFDSPEADRRVTAGGIIVALLGQAQRVAVIGLAYIRRGGATAASTRPGS